MKICYTVSCCHLMSICFTCTGNPVFNSYTPCMLFRKCSLTRHPVNTIKAQVPCVLQVYHCWCNNILEFIGHFFLDCSLPIEILHCALWRNSQRFQTLQPRIILRTPGTVHAATPFLDLTGYLFTSECSSRLFAFVTLFWFPPFDLSDLEYAYTPSRSLRSSSDIHIVSNPKAKPWQSAFIYLTKFVDLKFVDSWGTKDRVLFLEGFRDQQNWHWIFLSLFVPAVYFKFIFMLLFEKHT